MLTIIIIIIIIINLGGGSVWELVVQPRSGSTQIEIKLNSPHLLLLFPH